MNTISESVTYDHVDMLSLQRDSTDDNTGNNEIPSINNLSKCTKTDFKIDLSACTSRTQSVNFDANELLSNTTFDVGNLEDFENVTWTLLSTAARPPKPVTTDSDCSLPTYKQKEKVNAFFQIAPNLNYSFVTSGYL